MARSSRLVVGTRTNRANDSFASVGKGRTLVTLAKNEFDDTHPRGSSLSTGRVVNVDEHRITVSLSRGGEPLVAKRLASVADLEAGDEVVLAIVEDRPIVIGRIVDSAATCRRDVAINGRRIAIEADSELVLRCATATISIRRDGAVSIRGDRVTSQARSTNKIRGGSVELN